MAENFAWNGAASSLMPIRILLHINCGGRFLANSTRSRCINEMEMAYTFTFWEGMQPSPPCYTVIIAKCRRPAKKRSNRMEACQWTPPSIPMNFSPDHEHISDWALPFNVFQSDKFPKIHRGVIV
jgi:hypothetical protein